MTKCGAIIPQGLRSSRPKGRHHARGEVLHQHVGIREQRHQDFPARLGLQVQGDVALPRVQVGEWKARIRPRLVLVERPHPPAALPARRFNLQDVGPESGQQPRAVRPGDAVAQVEDTDAFKSGWRGHPSRPYTSRYRDASRPSSARPTISRQRSRFGGIRVDVRTSR